MNIDVLEHSTASVMIFRMMSQLDEKQGRKFDLRSLFNMNEEDNIVDVKITVNSVEVDPIKCLETCWKHLEDAYEKKAKELAVKMLSLEGLSDLQDKIHRAEWEINEAIDKALEKLRNNNVHSNLSVPDRL